MTVEASASDKGYAEDVREAAKALAFAMNVASGAGLTVEVRFEAVSVVGHSNVLFTPVVSIARVSDL